MHHTTDGWPPRHSNVCSIYLLTGCIWPRHTYVTVGTTQLWKRARKRLNNIYDNNRFEWKAQHWMKFLEGFHVLSMTRSGGELLLASCSQDCLIRVWKLRAKSRMDARAEDDHDAIRMKEDIFEVMERGEQPVHSALDKGCYKRCQLVKWREPYKLIMTPVKTFKASLLIY